MLTFHSLRTGSPCRRGVVGLLLVAALLVKVKENTPRVEWGGRTWYFCSEECKAAFLADPRHFVQ
jgi:YHS domain-containing protein